MFDDQLLKVIAWVYAVVLILIVIGIWELGKWFVNWIGV